MSEGAAILCQLQTIPNPHWNSHFMIDKEKLKKILQDILDRGFKLEKIDISNIHTIYFREKPLPNEIKQIFDGYLKENPDLEIFNGGMMNFGNYSARVEIDDLWKWLLRTAEEKSCEDAVEQLVRYLQIDETPGYDIFAIEGLNIDKPLELSNGITLLSVSDFTSLCHKKVAYREIRVNASRCDYNTA